MVGQRECGDASTQDARADRVDTDPLLVRRLLSAQLSQWADLPVRPVDSFGTDHDIYRLGEHLVVRMPRMAWAVDQVAIEGTWLPRIAPHVRLTVPVQRAGRRARVRVPLPVVGL